MEQRVTEVRLQLRHLLADRALGQAQLVGGAGEALVTGGGLEQRQGVQRQIAARHRGLHD
ncbi:hypothetical protein D3C78_1609830 [compost metagenome]